MPRAGKSTARGRPHPSVRTGPTAKRSSGASRGRGDNLGLALVDAQSDLGEGLAVLDTERGRFLHANRALRELLGRSLEELRALPSFDALIRDGELERTNGHRADLEDLSEVGRYECTLVRSDGERIDVEVATKTLAPRTPTR